MYNSATLLSLVFYFIFKSSHFLFSLNIYFGLPERKQMQATLPTGGVSVDRAICLKKILQLDLKKMLNISLILIPFEITTTVI
jgi:hypothetical protein